MLAPLLMSFLGTSFGGGSEAAPSAPSGGSKQHSAGVRGCRASADDDGGSGGGLGVILGGLLGGGGGGGGLWRAWATCSAACSAGAKKLAADARCR
jgi:hypothetical protein